MSADDKIRLLRDALCRIAANGDGYCREVAVEAIKKADLK